LFDDLGEFSVGLTFMDHRGTRFHEELHLFESLRSPSVCMDTICDNVLHPGAPVFLWEEAGQLVANAGRRAAVWSLPEFSGGSVDYIEDWMAYEQYLPRHREGQVHL